MALAVRVAHESFQEREEAGAGQVSGSNETCWIQNWWELIAGDSDDNENDYGPKNECHGPDWSSDDAKTILPKKKLELAEEGHHQWSLDKLVLILLGILGARGFIPNVMAPGVPQPDALPIKSHKG